MTTSLPTGWGGGGWGRTPWGAGSLAPFSLLSAFAIRENVVRLSFTSPPYFSGIGDPGDASDPSRFTVRAVSGIGIDGVPVRAVLPVSVEKAAVEGAGGTILDVIVDRPFSQYPCVYSITALGIRSSLGLALGLGSTKQFLAVQAGMRGNTGDQLVAGRDIANPQTLQALFDPIPGAKDIAASKLGTYLADGTGDIAADFGLTSYTKRVIRRIMSRKNGFAHLSGYGLGVPEQVKKLAKPGMREALASDAENQIRQEPETLAVAVRVVVRGDVTIYQVAAKTRFGDANLDIPVPNK